MSWNNSPKHDKISLPYNNAALLQPEADLRLLHLLNRCYGHNSKSVSEEILDIIRWNPSAARAKYYPSEFPLFIALKVGAPFDVVNALYGAFPEAARKQEDWTALHYACRYNASFGVISLLLGEYPDAVSKMEGGGRTPLHLACAYHESFEVVSFVLRNYPEAAKIQDLHGKLPLHHYCSAKPLLEGVSLLLESCPAAAEVGDYLGMTPLHHLCALCRARHCPSLSMEVVSLVLGKYPQASKVRSNSGFTPVHYICENPYPQIELLTLLLEKCPSAANIERRSSLLQIPKRSRNGYVSADMILHNVSCLVNKTLDLQSATRIINDFIQISWWGGVMLVFDLYSPALEIFEDIPLSVIPSLLSVVDRRCKMLTVWNFLNNKQDILKTN